MMQLTNKARITQLEKRFRASNKARIVSEITARQAQERLDAGEELLDADELSSDSDDSFDLEKDAEMKKERKAQRQLKRAQKKKKEEAKRRKAQEDFEAKRAALRNRVPGGS